jgi:hypothetical protein
MASKLWSAVVGVGISLGGTGGCSGKAVSEGDAPADDEGNPNDVGAGGASSTPKPPGVGAVTSGGSGPNDAGAPRTDGGSAGHAGSAGDAASATDAGIDPFCDAAWPTTKGNPGPPECVDPMGECADAGFPTYCAEHLGTYLCSGNTSAPFCVDATWQCPSGTLPIGECKCWSPLPEGSTCTENGVMSADAGSG